MIQIRRRWPVLASLVAALAYGANHYQLAGIEHLRLEPRPQSEQAAQGYATDGGPNSGIFDLSRFGIQPSSVFSTEQTVTPGTMFGESQSNAAKWREQLSVGEKLAMWQEQSQASDSQSLAGQFLTQNSYPVSTPIPLPNGFAPVTTAGRLPSTAAVSEPSLGSRGMPNRSGGLLATMGQESPDLAPMGQSIRIASFNTQSMGPSKLAKSAVVGTLVSILRQFDIVALQELRSTRDDLLPILVERLNQSGRRYDYVIGPRVGRVAPHDQYAIVFDTDRVETDRYQLYTVDDPDDLISFEPLVAWFRCKGVPQNEAFTFSLVNVRVDENFAEAERALLPGLIEAVGRDGRGEDDWIMAGDFAGDLSGLEGGGLRFAIQQMPTNVEGTHTLDSIFFAARATTEYTGRSGAYDFLRRHNLSIERALEISDHLPVWAEFSIVEGAEPGRVAPVDPQTVY